MYFGTKPLKINRYILKSILRYRDEINSKKKHQTNEDETKTGLKGKNKSAQISKVFV